jgi:hypothetical protein
MQRMWKVNTKVISIIISATGSVLLSFQKCLDDRARKHSSVELQNMAILGTAHILVGGYWRSTSYIPNVFSRSYYVLSPRDKVWSSLVDRYPER